MIAWWNQFCQVIGDALLGWSLRLHSDATLVVLAVLSAVIFTWVRVLTTNQDRLRRAAADKKQLKQLLREAKAHNDREAIARHQATRRRIRGISLVAEFGPVMAAIGPAAVLATWCAQRLEFHPPRAGQTVALKVYTPISEAGNLIHLLPKQGITSDGWVKRIEAVTDAGSLRGLAAWEVTAKDKETPYTLTVRYGSEDLRHELLVGSEKYASSVVRHAPELTSRFEYQPVQLLGRLPGLPAIHIPAWLSGYLLLTLPLVILLKLLLDIH